jgi:hypothetical protein
VYAIKKYMASLTYLDCSDNPLCEDKSYRCQKGGRGLGRGLERV